jgi:SAM-dependent methyltransferase
MVDFKTTSTRNSTESHSFIYNGFHSLAAEFQLWSLYNTLVDKFEGIDTAGYISYSELGINTQKGQYGPGFWWDLRMALGQKVSVDDVFIDFGSGKGRMVYLAARYYPFKKVIGVEITERLNTIAKKNIEKNLHKLRCKDVHLVTADVINYIIPDDVTVVYIYDPFGGTVFVNLINRLRISLNRYPREIRILYRHPVMHDCLIENGFEVASKWDDLSMYTETLKV